MKYLQNIIKGMLENGLIEVAHQKGVIAAYKLYEQIAILNYTIPQEMPDATTLFLRKYGRN